MNARRFKKAVRDLELCQKDARVRTFTADDLKEFIVVAEEAVSKLPLWAVKGAEAMMVEKVSNSYGFRAKSTYIRLGFGSRGRVVKVTCSRERVGSIPYGGVERILRLSAGSIAREWDLDFNNNKKHFKFLKLLLRGLGADASGRIEL